MKAPLARVAQSPASTVLLTGETGTGKDLAAKTIHYNSARAARSFVNITCSALPEQLLESELFGHERGAFTDARQQKKGLFEMAGGGTLFLDEIGAVTPGLQAKLLRFLEEKTFKRVDAVGRHVQTLRERGERVDYLTFVPDGEPTLDMHLDEEMDGLRPLGIPIAVISNGSLAWNADVRAWLGKADWVSLKVDAADDSTWRRVNRPHGTLQMATILDGMLTFAREFHGTLATETMLINGVNDDDTAVDTAAAFVEQLAPAIAYIAAPTRPPSEPWVQPASDEATNRAFQRFADRLPRVELLTGFEGTAFGSTGDAARDLLAITAVHPMREDAVLALLARAGADRGGTRSSRGEEQAPSRWVSRPRVLPSPVLVTIRASFARAADD